MEDTITFGQLLRRLRLSKLFTEEEVAFQIVSSRKHISNLELDKTKPTYEIVVDLACVLDVKPSILFAALGKMADEEVEKRPPKKKD